MSACSQHLGMNEDLVVTRHGAADLAAFEIDRDDVLRRHLVEPDAGGLHQKALRVPRQPRRDVPRHIVALVLAHQHAPRIGERLSQLIGHDCFPTPRGRPGRRAGTQHHRLSRGHGVWVPAFAGTTSSKRLVHQCAVLANPSFANNGSSDTRSKVMSCAASMVCACQHGMAMTSPGPSVSASPLSAVKRALPPITA